jgi:hypothetical protein
LLGIGHARGELVECLDDLTQSRDHLDRFRWQLATLPLAPCDERLELAKLRRKASATHDGIGDLRAVSRCFIISGLSHVAIAP